MVPPNLTPPFAAPSTQGAANTGTSGSDGAQAVFGSVDLATIHVETKYWSGESSRPNHGISGFLKKDLDVTRLEEVYDLLWWAGRCAPPRALHRQKLFGLAIAITEEADLHLIKSAGQVFIKPLPDYFLNYPFWETYICCDSQLYGAARGFLLSYIWIIRHRSDFEIAKETRLLPEALLWSDWKSFVDRFWAKVDPNDPEPINKRFHYGELRLSRLDQIYRVAPRFKLKHFRRGYLYSYPNYGGFFKRQFAWLIIAFAYISIVLSAMQVGLGTQQLKGNDNFHRGSYGFSVLAIIFPVSVTIIAILLYFGLFLYHLITTLKKKNQGEKRRKEINQPHNGGVPS